MISVDEALTALFALVAPTGVEEVPLAAAAGRVLARDVAAGRDQPPFDASAMDGYAIADAPVPGTVLSVIGEAAAGRGFGGRVQPGEAVRIFTGAPVPEGAARVVMQEDVTRAGDRITLGENIGSGDNIRPMGGDFRKGETIAAPRRLRPADLALLASMNIARVPVHRRPEVALIATGDELVIPGETPGPDQILASNGFGLKALLESHGAVARLLPIARDTRASLAAVLKLAEGNDLIVTIGGASVGDHDLVARLGPELGLERAFYKVAMRPGKPLMAGRMGAAAMVGLPGNPVSAMVCGQVFLAPMLRKMQGLSAARAPRRAARLAAPLPANGPREHYMRARLDPEGITAENQQDSSLLGILANADALLVRPPHDRARTTGETVAYIPL